MTTAMARGRGGATWRGKGNIVQNGTSSKSTGRGRGREDTIETWQSSASQSSRRGKKRAASTRTSHTTVAPARGRATSRNYNTGSGSIYYMTFGDDSSHRAAQVELPNLNQQTAPPEADS
jgi:hypothetical protein